MNREKYQIIAGIASVIVNAFLFGIKFWAGLVTGSVALMADAWHTLSDSLTSIFVVVAAKLASRKPNKKHPFGYGRWELIAAIIIAFVLALIGYEFLVDSINRFQNRESVTFGMIAIVVTVVSIIIKELLAQYAFYVGRITDNPVVTADGWHSRTDSLGSVVILLGILATKFIAEFWWMDSVLGIFCALIIFYAAYKVMIDAVTKILGEETPKELIEQINVEVKKLHDQDLKLHHFHLHNYITSKELTFHIMLKKDETIENGHQIATEIEIMIKEKFDIIATIHVEPLD